jgi:DnaJ-domain-containing protein 1
VKGLPAEVEAAIALRGRAVLDDEALTVAIRQLARASTAIRQGVLEALAAAAVSDGTVGPEEADMVRAIAIIFQFMAPSLPIRPGQQCPAAPVVTQHHRHCSKIEEQYMQMRRRQIVWAG